MGRYGYNRIYGNLKVFLYFTTQSNIWIGITCLIGLILMIKNRKGGFKIKNRIFAKFKLIFTTSIFLTGFAYCFLLAPVVGKGAWELQQVLLHVIVPAAAVLDFLIEEYEKEDVFSYKDSFLNIIPPLYYIGFATVGYFLNWGSRLGAFGVSAYLPYLGTVWWIGIMFVLMTGMGAMMIFVKKGKKQIKLL